MASSDPNVEASASTGNSPGAPADAPIWETGHVSDQVHRRPNHLSARSPRPKPQRPPRDTPIAGPRAGTAQSEPSDPDSAAASSRNHEPESQPASTCPVQPPNKSEGQRPGLGKYTTASGKLTRAPRATRAGEARRTTPGHEARWRGRPPATIKAHGQMPSNNSHWVPQTREARTTRNESRHGCSCQATPNPDTTPPTQEWRGQAERAHNHTAKQPSQEWRGPRRPEPKHTPTHRTTQPGLAR